MNAIDRIPTAALEQELREANDQVRSMRMYIRDLPDGNDDWLKSCQRIANRWTLFANLLVAEIVRREGRS